MNGNGEVQEAQKLMDGLEASLTPDEEPEGIPLAAYCEPLFDKLVVQTDPEKSMEGKLHIPDAHKQKTCVGTVLQAGEGRLLESGMICPPRVKQGDRIMFGTFAGIEIPEDYGKRIKVLREDEVLWIFPAPATALPAEKEAAA